MSDDRLEAMARAMSLVAWRPYGVSEENLDWEPFLPMALAALKAGGCEARGDDPYRPIIRCDVIPKMVLVTVGDKEEIYEPISSREYLEKKVLELQVLLDDQSQATGDALAGWQASEVLQDKLITALEEATDDIEAQVKADYPDWASGFPLQQRRYARDMEQVTANRALIKQARAKGE